MPIFDMQMTGIRPRDLSDEELGHLLEGIGLVRGGGPGSYDEHYLRAKTLIKGFNLRPAKYEVCINSVVRYLELKYENEIDYGTSPG